MASKNSQIVSATLRYAIAIVLVAFVIPLLISSVTSSSVLPDVLELLLLPLVIALIGSILMILEYRTTGRFVKGVVSILVYEYLLLDLVFSTAARIYHDASVVGYIIPTLILLTSGSLYFYGYNEVENGKRFELGLYAEKTAEYMFIASLGLFLLNIPELSFLSPFFIGIAIAGVVVNIWIFFYYRNEGKAAHPLSNYLKRHGTAWIFLPGVVGLIFGALEIPKPSYYNTILIAALLIVIGATVLILILRLYVVTSRFVERTSFNVFKKYEYKDEIMTNLEMNYLLSSINRFILSSEKEPLIIALASILARGDREIQDTEIVLSSVLNYQPIDISDHGLFEVKAILDSEMSSRKEIVKRVISRMTEQEEKNVWKNQKNIVQN